MENQLRSVSGFIFFLTLTWKIKYAPSPSIKPLIPIITPLDDLKLISPAIEQCSTGTYFNNPFPPRGSALTIKIV